MDPQSRVSQHGRRAQYGLAAVEGLVALSALSVAAFHLPPESARMTALFGVAIAAVLLGEHITVTDVIGVLIAMAGILAVQMARQAAP